MTTHFTADTHYGHANIIRYCGRPYATPSDFNEKGEWLSPQHKRVCGRDMTEKMMANHNAVVAPGDRVIHAGDFAFGSTADVIRYLRALNGNHEFVWGNHDDNLKQVAGIIDYYPDLKGRVKFLGDYAEIKVEGQDIIVMHYGMRVWNRSHSGTWQIYGHSHGTLPDDPHAQALDVGVDCHGYRPISFAELKALMAKKFWKPVDHHKIKDANGEKGLNLSPTEYAKHQRELQYLQLQKEFGYICPTCGKSDNMMVHSRGFTCSHSHPNPEPKDGGHGYEIPKMIVPDYLKPVPDGGCEVNPDVTDEQLQAALLSHCKTSHDQLVAAGIKGSPVKETITQLVREQSQKEFDEAMLRAHGF